MGKNKEKTVLQDTLPTEKTRDDEIAEELAEKIDESGVYAYDGNLHVMPYERRNVGKWYERWNETLQRLAVEKGRDECLIAELRLCPEAGHKVMRYPFEVADEVMHIRTQSWETLRVLEFLVNFWYATQPCVQEHPRTASAVSARQVAIKLSSIAMNNEDIAKAVEGLRHDSFTNGDAHHGEEMRLIPFARIVTDNDGEPILYYSVDWDLARLGFKDYLGEIGEAWANIKYRFANCLHEPEEAITAVEKRNISKAKEEYEQWIFTEEGENFREHIAKEVAPRMGKDWDEMTASERRDFFLEDGFNVYWYEEHQG